MDKLNAVLAEYQALRDAMLQNFRLQFQVYAVYASGLLVFYGLAIEHKVYDVILAVPLFSLALLFRFQWQKIVINEVGKYILQIEKEKIPLLVGTINDKKEDVRSVNLCIGWQHFWNETEKERGWPRYYDYSRIMLFIGFSLVPAVVYNIYNLVGPLLGWQKVSKLETVWLVLLLIVNLSLGFYMWCRIVYVRHKKRRVPSAKLTKN